MNVVGKKFGSLKVERELERIDGRARVRCQCDCGGTWEGRTDALTRKIEPTVRCSTCRNAKRVARGKRYGKLLAIKPTTHRAANGAVIWQCRCDCGNLHTASASNLSGDGPGKTRSCGKC